MRFPSLLILALLSLPALAKAPALQLPAKLQGKAVILAPTDPNYARAELQKGVKPLGEGGLLSGIVIQLKKDIPIYRMYSGPTFRDSRGNNNRFGQWWSYDSLRGTQTEFRRDYEVCQIWNKLTWVTRCTLKKGAVVAIGPGNSADERTCGNPGENYPINRRDWQIWISEAYNRQGAGKELVCPDIKKDYRADLRDITRADNAGAKKPGAPAKKPASKSHKPQLN